MRCVKGELGALSAGNSPRRATYFLCSAKESRQRKAAPLAVAPHEGLRHGLFATGRIELDRQAGIAVPESAVRLDEARPYVLLVQDEQVVRRAVELGPRGEVGGRAVRIVRSGLAEGDRVLAGTVGIVREGTRVKLTPVIGASAAGH